MTRGTPPPGLAASATRVFHLALGQMLWSRRTIFLAVLAATPVVVAAGVRLLEVGGFGPGARLGRAAMFGLLVWLLYVRFIVPALGVFYGTSLIADDVEDRTLTYLFVRPIPRGAVVLGKYAAYLVCTALIVLPSAMLTYFALVPFREVAATFPSLMIDLGVLALGLAAYGALFALLGAALRRPLAVGLVLVFGWEPIALMLPGYLKRGTLAYYLQSLVPHAMPPTAGGVLQAAFRETVPVTTAVAVLAAAWVVCLILAVRTVGRREYVLEQ
jgi:ABC-type transport system involved in multi-copper enzyme maturation permease subunit